MQEPVTKKEKPVELPATTVEKILKGDEEMLNIARNLASKSDEKINPADYIDKVKEELIKSGKLGADNYIDEQKKLNESEEMKISCSENDTAAQESERKTETIDRKWLQILKVRQESIMTCLDVIIFICQFRSINVRDQVKLFCN